MHSSGVYCLAYRCLNTMDRLQKKSSKNLTHQFPVVASKSRVSLWTTSFSTALWQQVVGTVFFNEAGELCCLPNRIEDWTAEALRGWNIKGKTKTLWSCTAEGLLWHMRSKRNHLSINFLL